MLPDLIAESSALTTLYRTAFSEKRGADWRVVLGFDEYTPGAQLAPDNKRKVMMLYMTFLDLGPSMLAEESVWIVPLCCRHCNTASLAAHSLLQGLLQSDVRERMCLAHV